jgi:hypothetical protein
MKKLVLAVAVLNLGGCVPLAQEYIKATAVRTTYEMKTSEYHTSMLTSKSPKDSSECIGNAFKNYNYDGDYFYGDTKVVQLKGENYAIVSKRPYDEKLNVKGNFFVAPIDYNIDQILFFTEINEGTSGKSRVEIWYNPDAVFSSSKIELAKTIVSPCI